MKQFQSSLGVLLPVWASVALLAAIYPVASQAQSALCDRQCLKGYADQLLQSLLAHEPALLPLSSPYAATENNKPFKLSGMRLWQTVTGVDDGSQYIIDPESGQVLLVAPLREGTHPAILVARLKIEDRKISELELDVTRSPADTGLNFYPSGLAKLPAVWHMIPAGAQRATHDVLANVGKSAFETSINVPFQPGCLHVEEGNPIGADECAAPPNRPADPHARVPVVDTAQGIVASFGDVSGVLMSSASFVPDSMMAGITPGSPGGPPANAPPMPRIIRDMRASATVVQLDKFMSGKVRATQAFMFIQGPGATSPWVQ